MSSFALGSVDVFDSSRVSPMGVGSTCVSFDMSLFARQFESFGTGFERVNQRC